jgi:predicted nucleic acid-binding protein
MSNADIPAQSCFIDSNIWIYAFIITQDSDKTAAAQQLLKTQKTIFLSTQVINEVCINLLKKANFTESEILNLIDDFYAQYGVVVLEHGVLRNASSLRERYPLSFWDSLILASALACDAEVLYSEDMQDGLVVEGITIINPLKTLPES